MAQIKYSEATNNGIPICENCYFGSNKEGERDWIPFILKNKSGGNYDEIVLSLRPSKTGRGIELVGTDFRGNSEPILRFINGVAIRLVNAGGNWGLEDMPCDKDRRIIMLDEILEDTK